MARRLLIVIDLFAIALLCSVCSLHSMKQNAQSTLNLWDKEIFDDVIKKRPLQKDMPEPAVPHKPWDMTAIEKTPDLKKTAIEAKKRLLTIKQTIRDFVTPSMSPLINESTVKVTDYVIAKKHSDTIDFVQKEAIKNIYNYTVTLSKATCAKIEEEATYLKHAIAKDIEEAGFFINRMLCISKHRKSKQHTRLKKADVHRKELDELEMAFISTWSTLDFTTSKSTQESIVKIYTIYKTIVEKLRALRTLYLSLI